MKRITVIVILICLWLPVAGNDGRVSNERCEIKGLLLDGNGKTIFINNRPVKVDAQGKFQYTFSLDKTSFVTLNYGKSIDLYLEPGDKVRLELDAEKDIRFGKAYGHHAEINNFMINESDFSEKLNRHFSENRGKILTLNEQQYTAKVNSLLGPFFQRLDAFPAPDDSRKRFKNAYRIVLEYSRANILIKYQRFYRRFNNKPSFTVSEEYLGFIKKLNLNDPQLLEWDESRSFLDNLLEFEAERLLKKDKALQAKNYKLFRAKFPTIVTLFQNETVKTELLYSLMKKLLAEYYHKGIDDLVVFFEKNCKNKEYIATVRSMLAEDKKTQARAITRVYKQTGDISLDVFIYLPKGFKKTDRRPVVAFFHGGGWECGKPQWGATQCEHFASKGLVAMSFEYRLITQHGTTPLESVIDAKSALRWIRKHAGEYGVDTEKIAVSGFSAGGHIALCTVTTDKLNEPHEDLSISSKANALILWVTPVKMSKDRWFSSQLKDKSFLLDCSPYDCVKPGLPPMIMFQGTADWLVSPQYTREFAEKMKTAKNRCDLHLYEGQSHLGWSKNSKDVYKKMDAFLASIGYLEK